MQQYECSAESSRSLASYGDGVSPHGQIYVRCGDVKDEVANVATHHVRFDAPALKDGAKLPERRRGQAGWECAGGLVGYLRDQLASELAWASCGSSFHSFSGLSRWSM